MHPWFFVRCHCSALFYYFKFIVSSASGFLIVPLMLRDGRQHFFDCVVVLVLVWLGEATRSGPETQRSVWKLWYAVVVSDGLVSTGSFLCRGGRQRGHLGNFFCRGRRQREHPGSVFCRDGWRVARALANSWPQLCGPACPTPLRRHEGHA